MEGNHSFSLGGLEEAHYKGVHKKIFHDIYVTENFSPEKNCSALVIAFRWDISSTAIKTMLLLKKFPMLPSSLIASQKKVDAFGNGTFSPGRNSPEIRGLKRFPNQAKADARGSFRTDFVHKLVNECR